MSQQGISEGAKLVTGGARPSDPALAKGSFYLPTIFDRCDRSMRIVQEETFGPILTVERFTTEAEAIELGNDTEYGLAAGVRTSDQARGERVVRALRHGTVWLNDFGYYTAAAEWGGFGKSGNGRELGPTGLAEYQEIKHIWHNTAPNARRLVQGLERTTVMVDQGAARRQRHGGLRVQGIAGPQHRQVRELRRGRQLHLDPHRHVPAVLLRLRHRRAGLPVVVADRVRRADGRRAVLHGTGRQVSGRGFGLQLVEEAGAAGWSAGRRAG